jgi:hypothetical protein
MAKHEFQGTKRRHYANREIIIREKLLEVHIATLYILLRRLRARLSRWHNALTSNLLLRLIASHPWSLRAKPLFIPLLRLIAS